MDEAGSSVTGVDEAGSSVTGVHEAGSSVTGVDDAGFWSPSEDASSARKSLASASDMLRHVTRVEWGCRCGAR